MNRLRFRVGIALGLLWLSACAGKEADPPPPGWKTLSPKGLFRVTVPEDLREVPVKAIDSFVGGYRSSTLTLDYDYGWYASTLSEWKNPQEGGYSEEETVIAGRPAKLVFSRAGEENARVYVAGVHFPEIGRTEGGVTSLTVTLDSVQPIATDLAKRIFMSIRIPAK